MTSNTNSVIYFVVQHIHAAWSSTKTKDNI